MVRGVTLRGRGVVRSVAWRTAWCVEWRGEAWRRFDYPGSTVFAVMVGVWEPEESRRKSNDINKKMITLKTVGNLMEIKENNGGLLRNAMGNHQNHQNHKTTKPIKNHQI